MSFMQYGPTVHAQTRGIDHLLQLFCHATIDYLQMILTVELVLLYFYLVVSAIAADSYRRRGR